MKLLVLRCWWIAFLALGACFSPQFQDGQIMCGPNDECPPGLECFAGVCRSGAPGVDSATEFPLTITLGGNMMGTVTSAPAGINCGTDCTATFPSGTMVTLTATPMSGSTFVGWNGACSGTGACTITVATAINVTANFAVDNSLVVSLGGNGSGVVSSSPAGINCGLDCMETFAPDTTVVLTASAATGSTFEGWSGAGCSGIGTCTVTTDVAKMVTATFSLSQHTLTVETAGTGSGTVSSAPAGIDCGASCTDTVNYNSMIMLTATPDTGSTFTGWSGACTGTGTCTVTVTAATTVTATFALTNHNVTVTKMGNGAGTVTSAPTGISCPGDCTEAYAYNTMVTLTATPANGSTFAGWSGGPCSGTGACNVTVTAATSVTATFTLNTYSLTVLKDGNGSGNVSSNLAGIDCGTDCSQSYDYNSMVTLTAMEAPGSTFTGWSGACSGPGSCVVTIDAAKSVTATFTLTKHALTVNLTGNGKGTVTGFGIDCHKNPNPDCSEQYNYNDVVTLTATPTTGSTFVGWSGPPGCTGTGTCEVTMTQARSVTAQFTLNKYAVSVTPAGSGVGTVASDPVGINCGADCAEDYDFGTVVTLTATPAASSVFTGWTGGGCVTNPCNITVQNAVNVTATFAIKTHTLTVTTSGMSTGTVTSNIAGINCGTDCTEPYNYGTPVTLTATPADGHTFNGWSGSAGCTGNSTSCVVTMDANKTATANFVAASSGLTVAKNGTGSGTVTSGETTPAINCGTDCFENYPNNTMVTLTATPATGSVFSGWSGAPSCSTNPTCTVTVTAAMTVSATFTLTVHNLTVTRNGAGLVRSNEATPKINCGSTCSAPYDYGSSVTLTAVPATDMVFIGWSGGVCSGTGQCTVSVTAATTVVATFVPVQYKLTTKLENSGGTVTSMPMGIDCGDDCSEVYNAGQVVMLLATPKPGYTFAKWDDACSGSSPMCSVTMNSDLTAYAVFEPVQYLLTVNRSDEKAGDVYSIDDPGIVCEDDCTELYDYGRLVPLKVSPNSGYTFTGWSGACSGTGECTVTMDMNRTVTANFVVTTYALTVNLGGNGSGVVTSSPTGISCGANPSDCSETYQAGTNVQLTAAAAADSQFVSWSGCTSVSGTTCNVSMNAAKGVTATFNKKTYALTVNKSGTGSGTVTSSPSGINCGATCSASFNHGTSITLTATPAAGSQFASWTNCSSTNMNVCTVTNLTAARTVTAQFTQIPANKVFVTTATYSLNTIGSVANADMLCQNAANAASLGGTYVALLSSSTSNVTDRIGNTSGWVRVDGRPFANTKADLLNGRLYSPPRIAQNGSDVGDVSIVTGTSTNGMYSGSGDCSNFTSTTGNVTVGLSHAGSSMFYNYGTVACSSTTQHLLCIGTGNLAVVTPPAPTGTFRRAFMRLWGSGGGLADADAKCQADATAQNLPGTYKALLPTSTATALSRFDTSATKGNWYRVDNMPILPSAAAWATATYFDSAPNVNAKGDVWFSNFSNWAGASSLTSTAANAAVTCSDYTTTSGTGRVGTAGVTRMSGTTQSFLGNNGFTACTTTSIAVVCLQQ